MLLSSHRACWENTAKNAQIARLSREDNLSNLKLRLDANRAVPVSSFRGFACLVICAGLASFITESFKFSKPFTEGLVERGVLVVPFATDGNSPSFELDESEESRDFTSKRKRIWQLSPVVVTPWNSFVAQLLPIKGMWSGLLDGFDGV